MTTIDHLLAQAQSADHTPAEQAAALTAASRLGVTVIGAPDGYCWRDGRLVPTTSPIPPLKLKVRSKWDERPEPEEDEVSPPTPQVPSSPGRPNRRRVLLDMIQRDGGATVDELLEATGLDITSARALVSIARSKGMVIDFDRATRRYSVAQSA